MVEASRTAPLLARRLNIDAVLDVLWSGDATTVNDLMDATRLTRATVHSICNDLVDHGWIRELESGSNGEPRPAGRPARIFELNREAGYVLGLDVGYAHLGVMVANLAGEPQVNKRFDIAQARNRSRRAARITRSIAESLKKAGISRRQVIAAGVGLAAPVSRQGDVVGFGKSDLNPYWEGFRLDHKTLTKALAGTTLLTDNDANLALLGERWRGVAREVDDLVVLLASERLGAGIMEAGRVLKGHAGGAGEMSWLDLVNGAEGADGFAYLARTWARKAVARRRNSMILELAGGKLDNITAEIVFAAAAQGDDVASGVIDRLAASAAQIICITSMMLNPELVVLDGAIAGSADALLPRVEQELTRMVHDPPRVACSTLGESVVAIGAVRFALDHVQANALRIELPARQREPAHRMARVLGR